jgi:membrane protease YdiL (CAAX protease family)
MSDDPANTDGALPAQKASAPVNANNWLRWLELTIVLLVAFGSSILGSTHLLITGQASRGNVQTYESANAILHESTCLLLLGYVLYRRKARFADIGFKWSWSNVFAGGPVTVVAYLSYWIGSILFRVVQHAIFVSTSTGHSVKEMYANPSLLAIPYLLLNPFFEELIVRAYLMTEIRALTKSWTLACLLSVGIQTAYHLYYGWAGALSISFIFVVFSVYFARKQRAVPIIVAHGLFDVLGMVQVLR